MHYAHEIKMVKKILDIDSSTYPAPLSPPIIPLPELDNPPASMLYPLLLLLVPYLDEEVIPPRHETRTELVHGQQSKICLK